MDFGALTKVDGPDATNSHKTPTGYPVLVYRPHLERWDGPYSFTIIKSEEITEILSPF